MVIYILLSGTNFINLSWIQAEVGMIYYVYYHFLICDNISIETVYRFILTPGQLDPQGSRYLRAAWHPGGVKISRGIFTPALIIHSRGWR